ncbi:MAG: PQQ-binding-like beta-propeller repeat protein [Planctomycetes bacterium]|nr:PQQ-binding-like beta-propeller repeat protein [Planctomycetota bacterium]
MIPTPGSMQTSALHLGLAAALAAATTTAQDPTAPVRELTRPMEFSTGQDDNLFSLRRSQDDIHAWDRALDELQAGDIAGAVERLHKLLQNESGGVAPIAPGRFQGLRLAVETTMANMSPAARQAYEQLVSREAGYLAERPPHQLMPEQLELLASRYPTSRVGLEARVRLGDLALEAGDGAAAVGHYRSALDATPIGSSDERRLVDRMLAARTLNEPSTARADRKEARLESAAAAVLDVLPVSSDPTGYRAVGGGGDGRTPMPRPAGRPVPRCAEAVFAHGFEERESGFYAMHAVGDLDGLYVNTGREVLAFDPLRNDLAWASVTPLGDAGDPTPDFRGRSRRFRGQRGGQVNHDMVLAAAVGGDLVVAALQVPERSTNVDFHNNFRILSKIPQRRTFAFSRATGKTVWAHFDELDGPVTRRFRGQDACGPPLVVGDTVYVPIHDRSGAIAFSVGAYDLRTGKPKWRRLVCSSQQEVNMFGNARMEFAASPLCVADGVIYGASNLGVVFAIDAADGTTRWVTAHDVVRMPTASLRQQQERAVYFMNNVPVVTDGVVCMTPLDSPYVLGFDAETGRQLWQVPASAPVDGNEHDVRWLCGAIDDEFILTGRGAIAVKARPDGVLSQRAEVRSLVPREVFQQGSGGTISGRPAVTADHVWVGRRGSITAFDRAGNGIESAAQIRVEDYQGGNLVFVDGIAVSVRLGAFEVFYDRAAVLARVEERYRQSPDDPAAILQLATLRAALLPAAATAADRQAVTELYREGLAVCQRRGLARSHPVRRALQGELYEQARLAAEVALRSGDRRTFELLTEAREVAPDTAAWLTMQLWILDQCAAYPRRLATELDRLEREGAGASLPLSDGPQPVRAYVLYRRAQLPGSPPADAVASWQELLESFGDAVFEGTPARDLASRAIAGLIARHGAGCYAAIAERADAALAAAGDDAEALRAVSARFPNSAAADTARTRVLDASVARGELGVACDVLAQELLRGKRDPRVLRRVLVAARVRGNLGLARAVATALAPHGDEVSDWPADGGRSYRAVLAELAAELDPTPPPNRLGLPLHEVTRIRPRSAKESFRLMPTIQADGFTVPADTPLFAVAGPDLLAIDVHAAGTDKPILFALPTQFLDHVVLCGDTLVVPDLDRVLAVDYRSGQLRWQLDGTSGKILDGLGVQDGVFHLSIQPGSADGPARFVGIEPLSGRTLFSRPLPGERMRSVPKPIPGQLLAMQADDDQPPSILRLDPFTGATLAEITLSPEVPRTEGITTRIYPQALCGDAERVYLPIDSTFSGDAPQLFAVGDDGAIAWKWRGQTNRHLLMAALRGEKIVIVEGGEEQDGSVSLLRARDGEVEQRIALGHDIDVLNWQRTFLANPAPPALLLSDLASNESRERRIYCLGIEPGVPSFVEALSAEHDEIERQPQLGDGFLTFGVRPNGRGPFRLYCIDLATRDGRLPGGQKYRSLRIDPTYALSAIGSYTVLCCAEYLVVLGPEDENR